MLLTYLKLSFRLLVRNPFFSLLNIVGLATGFAAFLILWPYAQAELNTDKFHKDYDKIARLGITVRWTDDNVHWNEWDNAQVQCGAGAIVQHKLSQVTDMTRLIPQESFSKRVQGADREVIMGVLNAKGQKVLFHEKTTAYADSNFFRFFSFPLIKGRPGQVLARPRSAALSERTAEKYFGKADPVGKVIYLNDSIPFHVGGVFQDLPSNTHFQFDILLSTVGTKDINVISFDWMGYNFLKVKDGDFDGLRKQLKARQADLLGPTPPNLRASYLIHPLPEVAFKNMRGYTYEVKSRQPLVLLNLMAFVILGLAFVNYVSLSIHQLHKRLPEIGTRKAVGATLKNFAGQFLVEAALLNLTAFLLALTLVQVVGEGLTRWFGFYLVRWSDLSLPSMAVIGLVLVGGVLLTGLYPVWMATRFKPLQLLKKLKTYRGPKWVNAIVTVQYTSALVLLVWIGAVFAQLRFILNQDLGIDQKAVLVVDSPIKKSVAFPSQLRTFLDRARTVKGVAAVSISEVAPGGNAGNLYVKRNVATNEMSLDLSGGVDEHFLPLYGIRLLAGRNFGANQPADQTAVLLSKDAVKRMGYAGMDEALGSKILLPYLNNAQAEIVGIYQDYEFRPFLAGMREEGRGSILTYKNAFGVAPVPNKISVKVNLAEVGETVKQLESVYQASFEDPIFEWTFLEDNLEKHYRSEKIARNQITLFTGIAIFIACLGLLGMISNKAVEKTKEIGIRKVFGARKHHIARLLLSATVVQVGVATLLGIPLAHYLIGKYLEKFSHKVPLQWWHYGVPLAMLLVIMGCTVVSVLLKAAKRNPVDSLRYE